ncbi:hypothetical protein EBZ39_06225 [bacterium]|nr:hypothetical protein [bacterium]
MSFLIEKYAFRDGICAAVNADATHVDVSGPCYSCGEKQAVRAKIEDLARFRNGEFAQDCFPYLPAADREFLISGICGKCWERLFAENEEETYADD